MAGKEVDQTFNFETMAVVLYCVLESGVIIGDRHYQMMSAADGTRSAAAFQHQFRKVKARAKELQRQAANGAVTAAMPSAKSCKGATKSAAPGMGRGKGTKRGRKAAAGDAEESLAKKVKLEQAEEEIDEF